MYNKEILEKLIAKYGAQRAIEVCDIISTLYDIKYNACKTRECQEEYDYERDWWSETANGLRQSLYSSNS